MLSYKSGKICVDPPVLLKRARIHDFAFSDYTTYGVGGGAAEAYFPRTVPEAMAVYDSVTERGMNMFVLSQGSNILASDKGFDGCVVCTRRLRGIVRTDKETVFCLAGTPVSHVLSYCISRGLGGLEYLAGIPAAIGGVAVMNGGAGGRYINTAIKAVRLYDGKLRNLSNENCNFSYKQSTMRNIKCIVTGVFLNVFADFPLGVKKRVQGYAARREHLPKGRSCGCVFKNPESVSEGKNLSAGALIEKCGLAGFGSARAFVSPVHCNFVLNNGACAKEIFDVIQSVKRLVLLRSGIGLEEEVVYVGDFGS